MFTSILVATDGSETAAEAVRHAAAVARAFSAPLHVVSAYGVPDATPEAELDFGDVGDWKVQPPVDVAALLAGVSQELGDGLVKVATYAVPGHPVRAILDVARQVGADLIVVGNKGMQGVKRVIGSVPNSVAHRAPCHVLIVYTTELEAQPTRPGP